MTPKLFVYIGLPASGKSTYAKELAEKYNALILSSDDLREEMFGDVNHQEDNDKLFKELHHRIRFYLYNGKNVVYDACNISYKRRMEFLKSLNKIPCEKIAVLMATPYEMCLERNKNRERRVPEHVIKRMYMNFDIPYWYEGWQDIWIEYAPEAKDSFGKAILWLDSVKDFSQDNPHHTLTLGEHCSNAYMRLANIFWGKDDIILPELLYAALLHDNGKVFTKAFVDSKGNPSEVAHFYQHQCVGAYNSLFYKYPANHIHVAALINWHMRPYLAWDKSEKAREKDRKLLGEEFYNEVSQLHEADVYAH